jgi:hypothetical protein
MVLIPLAQYSVGNDDPAIAAPSFTHRIDVGAWRSHAVLLQDQPP